MFIKFASSCVARSVARITSCALIWDMCPRDAHEPSCLVTGRTCRAGVLFWELNKLFALAVFTSLVHTGSRCAHAQEPWEIVSERDLHTYKPS